MNHCIEMKTIRSQFQQEVFYWPSYTWISCILCHKKAFKCTGLILCSVAPVSCHRDCIAFNGALLIYTSWRRGPKTLLKISKCVTSSFPGDRSHFPRNLPAMKLNTLGTTQVHCIAKVPNLRICFLTPPDVSGQKLEGGFCFTEYFNPIPNFTSGINGNPSMDFFHQPEIKASNLLHSTFGGVVVQSELWEINDDSHVALESRRLQRDRYNSRSTGRRAEQRNQIILTLHLPSCCCAHQSWFNRGCF